MNKVLSILLICFISSCSLPNRVHEKIDIARYNSTQVNGVARLTLKNGIIVEQSKTPDGAYIQRSVLPSYPNYPSFNGINIYREFYDTGELRVWWASFCLDFYNKGAVYAKDGKRIPEKTINFDLPYRLSLVFMRNKLIKEFNTDIFNGYCFVSRSVEGGQSIYKMILPVAEGPYTKRTLTIDANTGIIISNDLKRDTGKLPGH